MTAEPPPRISETVVDAIVQAYYPTVVGAAAAVRQRAQGAYAIAAAIAAGIVTAGALGAFEDQDAWIQALGVGALVLWLMAAWFYLNTVAGGAARQLRPVPVQSAQGFAGAVLEMQAGIANQLERRLKVAIVVTGFAFLLTVLAVVAALLSSPDPKSVQATVALTERGTATLASLCGGSHRTTLTGRVAPSDLSAEFVSVELAPGECSNDAVTVRIRADDIVIVRSP